MATIRDIISGSNTRHDFVAAACEQLRASLGEQGPIVTWLHGGSGSGRRQVLDAFAEIAAGCDIANLRLDGRTVEPTPAGVCAALSERLDSQAANPDELAAEIASRAEQTLLVFENYEALRVVDSWLRRDFIPTLDASIRVLLCSAEPPTAGWMSSAIWQPHFNAVSLAAADIGESGVDALHQIGNTDLKRTLETLSVVRRITCPMLAALCPDCDADATYDALAELPFVHSRSDGLAMDDALQQELSERLQAANPERYRDLQRAAWRYLRDQLQRSARRDLWRSTADVIFLIENPVIREAFFPSESARYSVEPAQPSDEDEIFAIVAAREPRNAAQALELWWKNLPGAFHVVRDAAADMVGFYCVAEPHDLDSSWMRFDPVANLWLQHLAKASGAKQPAALFLRRWLGRDDGERPGAVQAATWIDVKRTYLELRPDLRRVYLVLQDIEPYAAVATELGFRVLDDATARFGDTPYYSAMLDFGPGSVDGWICHLLAAELGITDEQLLDADSRELQIGDLKIALTPLEFGVVAMLEARSGAAVSRTDLLQQVWGRDYEGGSNVVDAVVRGLRKKLGEQAGLLETVRGVGYRLDTR